LKRRGGGRGRDDRWVDLEQAGLLEGEAGAQGGWDRPRGLHHGHREYEAVKTQIGSERYSRTQSTGSNDD